jgi:hypothetical protein
MDKDYFCKACKRKIAFERDGYFVSRFTWGEIEKIKFPFVHYCPCGNIIIVRKDDE